VYRRAIDGIRSLATSGVEVWISAVLHRENRRADVLRDFIKGVVEDSGCGRFYFSPVRNFTGGLQPFLLTYAEIAAAQDVLSELSDAVEGVQRVILDHPYEAVWRDYFWPLRAGGPSRLSSLSVDAYGNVLEVLGPRCYRKLDVFPHGPWGTCRIDARGAYLPDVESRTFRQPYVVGTIADTTPADLQRRAMKESMASILQQFLDNMQTARELPRGGRALTTVSVPGWSAATVQTFSPETRP
jgi:hypothetical protein